MAKRDIGIKNSFRLYQVLICVAFGVFALLTIIFWMLYREHLYNNYLLHNGIEVKAEIIDVFFCEDTDDDGAYFSWYEGEYLYISPEGKRYLGSCGLGAWSYNEKDAQSKIGTKITIVIDPNSTDSQVCTLAYLASNEDKINKDFPFACTFSGLLFISAYLLFYRVVYRKMLDNKINNMLEHRFAEDCAIQGEVIEIFGLIWFYVKVQFVDERGMPHIKWARAWFSRREAKFLKEKKYINIVPYKNTYGILEEM